MLTTSGHIFHTNKNITKISENTFSLHTECVGIQLCIRSSLLCEPVSLRVTIFVMQLVHATGKTWYKVLYQHTMYVISLSNISIKTNNKGWIKICTILSGRLHFVYDVTLFFPFIHHCQVTVFCLTFQWYDVMSK